MALRLRAYICIYSSTYILISLDRYLFRYIEVNIEYFHFVTMDGSKQSFQSITRMRMEEVKGIKSSILSYTAKNFQRCILNKFKESLCKVHADIHG